MRTSPWTVDGRHGSVVGAHPRLIDRACRSHQKSKSVSLNCAEAVSTTVKYVSSAHLATPMLSPGISWSRPRSLGIRPLTGTSLTAIRNGLFECRRFRCSRSPKIPGSGAVLNSCFANGGVRNKRDGLLLDSKSRMGNL